MVKVLLEEVGKCRKDVARGYADSNHSIQDYVKQHIKRKEGLKVVGRFPQSHNVFKNVETEVISQVCRENAAESVDCVIGSCVLDTLKDSDVSIAVQHMHTILKVNGLVIHFASHIPFSDTLLSSYKKEHIVCFPWTKVNNIVFSTFRLKMAFQQNGFELV